MVALTMNCVAWKTTGVDFCLLIYSLFFVRLSVFGFGMTKSNSKVSEWKFAVFPKKKNRFQFILKSKPVELSNGTFFDGGFHTNIYFITMTLTMMITNVCIKYEKKINILSISCCCDAFKIMTFHFKLLLLCLIHKWFYAKWCHSHTCVHFFSNVVKNFHGHTEKTEKFLMRKQISIYCL